MRKNEITLKSYLIQKFIIAILIAIVASGFLMSFIIGRASRERILKGDEWLLTQLRVSAEYLSGQAENLSATLAFDSDIQSALIDYQYGENPGLEQIRIRINNNLLYRSKFNSALYDCRNIVLFSNKGDVIGSKESFRQNTKIWSYDWAGQVAQSQGKSIWLPIGYDNNSSSTRSTLTIPIVRKIFSTQSGKENTLNEIMTVGKELGYIIVYINASMFSDLVAEDANVYTKRFFLIDENQRIISCKDERKLGEQMDLIPSNNGYITYEGQDYLMTQEALEHRGWTYLCLTSKAEITREVTIVVTVSIIIGLILIAIFSVIGILLSRNIALPVAVLVQHFKKAENGNITIQEKTYITEFKNLYSSFNDTMQKIHNLANEVYENKLVQQELMTNVKESQIQALRMQINPHFLYNTLDCINWQAQMNGDRTVAEMIRILGKFFRSNTDAKETFITIKQELENIEVYITLSKLRFGSRLHCFIETDAEIEQLRILKLLLQPLVENSIKYGLERECFDENIWIWCGQEDDEIVISVKDNGKGIEASKLEEIRLLWFTMQEGYKKTDSVGLYNVMRRLYLTYKEQCNFEIFSKVGHGTEIIITLPKK